jgi:hypothetical protein
MPSACDVTGWTLDAVDAGGGVLILCGGARSGGCQLLSQGVHNGDVLHGARGAQPILVVLGVGVESRMRVGVLGLVEQCAGLPDRPSRCRLVSAVLPVSRTIRYLVRGSFLRPQLRPCGGQMWATTAIFGASAAPR